jgi:hypothetical protein
MAVRIFLLVALFLRFFVNLGLDLRLLGRFIRLFIIGIGVGRVGIGWIGVGRIGVGMWKRKAAE